MKNFLILLSFLSIFSCATENVAQKESTKTIKHGSASERINSTNKSSDDLFKEIAQ